MMSPSTFFLLVFFCKFQFYDICKRKVGAPLQRTTAPSLFHSYRSRVSDPFQQNTVCQGSSDTFYLASYYIQWVTTSWTYCNRSELSIKQKMILKLVKKGSMRVKYPLKYCLCLTTLLVNLTPLPTIRVRVKKIAHTRLYKPDHLYGSA